MNSKFNNMKNLCNNNNNNDSINNNNKSSSSFDNIIKGMITDLYSEKINSSTDRMNNKMVDFGLKNKLNFASTMMGHRANNLNNPCYVPQQQQQQQQPKITSNLYAFNKTILDNNKVILDKIKMRNHNQKKQTMNQTRLLLSDDEYVATVHKERTNKMANFIVHNESASVTQQRVKLTRQQQQQHNIMPKSKKDLVVYDTLFVGNLHASLQEFDLMQVFKPYGEIVECCKRWIHFGFVKFSNEEDAVFAFLKLNGFSIKGRPMRLEFQKGDKHFSNDSIFQYKSRNSNNKVIDLKGNHSSKVDNESSSCCNNTSPLFVNLLKSKGSIINKNYCDSNESMLIDKEKLLRFAYGYFTENEQKQQNYANSNSERHDIDTKEWLDLDTLSRLKQNKVLVLNNIDKSLSSTSSSASSSSSSTSSSSLCVTKSSTSNCKLSSWLFDEQQKSIELNESNNNGPLSQYINIIERQTNNFDNDDDGTNSCFSNTSDDASTIPTSDIGTYNVDYYPFVSQYQEYHLFPDM